MYFRGYLCAGPSPQLEWYTDEVSYTLAGVNLGAWDPNGVGLLPECDDEETLPGFEICYCENPDSADSCEVASIWLSAGTAPLDHTVTVAASGDVRIWEGSEEVEDPTWTEFIECGDGDDEGAAFNTDLDVAFLQPGVHTLTATVTSGDANCSDTVVFTAYGVTLDVEGGGEMCLNSDDDDNSGTPDYTQIPWNTEYFDDDVKEVRIIAGGSEGAHVCLTKPDYILVWTTRDKTELAPSCWDLENGQLSVTVYIEGVGLDGGDELEVNLVSAGPQRCKRTDSVDVNVEGIYGMYFDRQVEEPDVYAQAFVSPPDTPVSWSVKGDDYGYSIDADGKIRPGPQYTREGELTVVATMTEAPACQTVGQLHVSACECSGDACYFGGAGVHNGSIDVQFGLGRLSNGESAGALRIYARLPSTYLSRPAGLTYPFAHGEIVVIEDYYGIRQVRVPQGLADVDYDPGYPDCYGLCFYENQYVGDFNEQTGLYDLQPGAVPLVAYQIENPDPEQGCNALWVSMVEGAQTVKRYAYTYSVDGGETTWALETGDATLVYRTETRTWDSATHCRYEIAHNQDAENPEDPPPYYVADEAYTFIGDAKVLTQLVVDPDDGGAQLVTAYAYYDDAAPLARLKWVQESDGSWTWYTYYDSGDFAGRLQAVYSSWNNIPFPADPEAAGARKVLYEYDPANPGEFRPKKITETIGTTTVAITEFTYAHNPDGTWTTERWEKIKPADPQHAGYLVTTTTFDPVENNRPLLVIHPDGRADAYDYVEGNYEQSDPEEPGVFTPDSGNFTQVTILHGVEGDPDPVGIPNKSTLDVIIRDAAGKAVLEETYVYVGGGSPSEQISWTVRHYDGAGRPTHVHHSDNTHEETSWETCCGVDYTIDRMGIRTDYDYDPLGRVTSRTKEGISTGDPDIDQDDIATSYTYQALANPPRRKVITTVSDESGHSLTTTALHDLAGRIVSQVDPASLETTYEYDDDWGDGDGRKVTVDRPGGTSEDEITEYHRDGRVKSVTGTGVVHRSYTYEVQSDGTVLTTVYTGPDGAASERWTKAAHDGLGRVISETRRAYDTQNPTNTVVTAYAYDDGNGTDSTGRLLSVQTSDDSGPLQAATLYEYDELSNVVRTGLDLDGMPGLQTGGTDRINDTDTVYVKVNGHWWRETTTATYLTAGSSNPTTTSIRRERLTGFASDDIIREIESEDLFGNVTRITMTLNAAQKLVTETTDFPAADNNAVRVTRNGLLQTVKDKAQLTTVYTYDGLGRRTRVIDPRGVWTQTNYADDGRVSSVETSYTESTSAVTMYDYYDYPGEDAGRLQSVENPLGKMTYYDYNDRGQITHIWGEVPQPVYLGYDDYGQRIQLSTFRDTSVTWTNDTWPPDVDPDDPADADITRWDYDPATGLLETKTYAYGTPEAKSVTYTYRPDGKLDVRTWARLDGNNDPITTTYGYNEGSSGSSELTGITYSDPNTPNVTFAYTRHGQFDTVTDALETRAFTYDTQGARLLETFDAGSIFNGKVVKTNYTYLVGYGQGWPQPLYKFAGRIAAIGVGPNASQAFADYKAEYSYNNETNHLEKVKGHVVTTRGVEYQYLENSHLVERLDFMGNSGPLATTTYAHEQYRNLIHSVENKYGVTQVSKYTYRSDILGRREWVIREGTAYGNGHHDRWSYNNRNELISSVRCAGTDPNQPCGTHDKAFREYAYDPIGNRTSYTKGLDDPLYYCTNAFNQYTHTDETTTCPPADPDESFSYDADGNLTEDGAFTYVWDAENRLAAVIPKNPVDESKKLKFTYDYMGRRVRKQVFDWDPAAGGGAGGWVETPEIDRRYVYYNWLLLMEYEGQDNTKLRKYVWGLDLGSTGVSPDLGEAGGIRGLLAVRDVPADVNYLYFHDANGNVGQLVERLTGSVDAAYQYDAYGNLTASSGPFADANPFRFSTKYWDGETSLGYWGYRYYSPRLGRWMNRDPIQERGGENLYTFVFDNPLTWIDDLGRSPRWAPAGPGMQEFWDTWTAAQRAAWINAFNKSYGPYLDQAAAKYCVPRELLAAVTAAEGIEWTRLRRLAEFTGFARTYGPAQISMVTAQQMGCLSAQQVNRLLGPLSPEVGFDFPSKFLGTYMNIKGNRRPGVLELGLKIYLEDPEASLDMAACMIRKYLRQLCSRAATSGFSKSFQDIVAWGCNANSFCCLLDESTSCSQIAQMNVPACVLRVMSAIWNNGPGIVGANDVYTDPWWQGVAQGESAGSFDDLLCPDCD